MRHPIVAIAVLGVALLGATAPSATAGVDGTPTLVAIRVAGHPGFDRVVFEFANGLPELRRTAWSTEPPTLDPSGLPSGAHGNAFLTLVWWDALGHSWDPPYGTTYGPAQRAVDLPNVAHIVNTGDFEAVLSFAIGVMERPSLVRIRALHDPPRWVVDLGATLSSRTVRVWYLDRDRIDGAPPYVVPVTRQVPTTGTARSTLERLFAGPTSAERTDGLRFVRSEATGYTRLRISDTGVARVQLTGGCNAHGSSLVTIDSELAPTLRALPRVDWVKVYDPDGSTERPWGLTDSIPACLEP